MRYDVESKEPRSDGSVMKDTVVATLRFSATDPGKVVMPELGDNVITNVWFTQAELSRLFNRSRSTICERITAGLRGEFFTEEKNIRGLRGSGLDGDTRAKHYDLSVYQYLRVTIASEIADRIYLQMLEGSRFVPDEETAQRYVDGEIGKLKPKQEQDTAVEYNPVKLRSEKLRLSQEELAKLFNVDRVTIARHIRDGIRTGDLDENSVCSKSEHTATDGKTYMVKRYNDTVVLYLVSRVTSNEARDLYGEMTRKLKVADKFHDALSSESALPLLGNHSQIAELSNRLGKIESKIDVIASAVNRQTDTLSIIHGTLSKWMTHLFETMNGIADKFAIRMRQQADREEERAKRTDDKQIQRFLALGEYITEEISKMKERK